MSFAVDMRRRASISPPMENGFIPTRTAALERLSAFLPHAGRKYAARRNFDLGPGCHKHVSCLSPYLRLRLLTEAEVITAVLDRHGAAASEKFVQEVFWRTYWKGWLELRPAVWEHYQVGLNQAWNTVQTQDGLRARWEEACCGNTEIDCFNAWARELASTGYLHNHARMWFASIWIFTLKLPWELGADFFLRHLLDGDPASNTLSWRWVAGIQTQGKTYLARTGNISKYTEGRFHPKWQLSSQAAPLYAQASPEPRELPFSDPLNSKLRTGFLLHEEDLCPDLVLGNVVPAASAILSPQISFSPLKTAQIVTQFRASALSEVAGRWSDKMGQSQNLNDAEGVVTWAKHNRIEQIATAYAPTGPVSRVLQKLRSIEGAPQICQVLRPFDKMTWPHATKGFFAFKKSIPEFTYNLNQRWSE